MKAQSIDTQNKNQLKSTHIVTTQTVGKQTLQKLIEKKGGNVTHIPMLGIKPLNIGTIKQKACYQADIWIFLSQHSVTSNGQLLKKIYTDQHIIAIGPGTQTSLEEINLSADSVPETDFSSTGIASLDHLQNNTPQKIIIFSESTKPQPLCSMLKEKGHTIAHIPTYTHQPLNTNTIANHFTELNHTIDYITTHSQKGLLHLLTCIKQEQLIECHNKTIVVTCRKMALLAKKSGFKSIIQSQNNTAESIVNTLITHRRGTTS